MDTLDTLAMIFSIAMIVGWVLSGLIGAGWLMLKGYTMEMLGCLGLFYGGQLVLMATLGPIMLFIAWAVPSRTDPTQQGGIKKVFTSKPGRKSIPSQQPSQPTSVPSRPAVRSSSSRRPEIPGNTRSSSRSIPPSRSSGSRPKPPPRR